MQNAEVRGTVIGSFPEFTGGQEADNFISAMASVQSAANVSSLDENAMVISLNGPLYRRMTILRDYLRFRNGGKRMTKW